MARWTRSTASASATGPKLLPKPCVPKGMTGMEMLLLPQRRRGTALACPFACGVVGLVCVASTSSLSSVVSAGTRPCPTRLVVGGWPLRGTSPRATAAEGSLADQVVDQELGVGEGFLRGNLVAYAGGEQRRHLVLELDVARVQGHKGSGRQVLLPHLEVLVHQEIALLVLVGGEHLLVGGELAGLGPLEGVLGEPLHEVEGGGALVLLDLGGLGERNLVALRPPGRLGGVALRAESDAQVVVHGVADGGQPVEVPGAVDHATQLLLLQVVERALPRGIGDRVVGALPEIRHEGERG